MSLLTRRVTLGFLLLVSGSLPLHAATPPALSSPSASPESPWGPNTLAR